MGWLNGGDLVVAVDAAAARASEDLAEHSTRVPARLNDGSVNTHPPSHTGWRDTLRHQGRLVAAIWLYQIGHRATNLVHSPPSFDIWET
jgi:hypothetical protein